MDIWSVRTVRCHGDVVSQKGGVLSWAHYGVLSWTCGLSGQCIVMGMWSLMRMCCHGDVVSQKDGVLLFGCSPSGGWCYGGGDVISLNGMPSGGCEG